MDGMNGIILVRRLESLWDDGRLVGRAAEWRQLGLLTDLRRLGVVAR